MTGRLDIWIKPDTPKCQEIIQIIGDDPRVRLIDADQFRLYVPRELREVPGFVWKDKRGKNHPWDGDKCLEYVRLYFTNANNHLIGQQAGAPIMDVRHQQRYPQQQQQPMYPSYNRPQQPQSQYPQQQPQRPPQQPNYNQPMRTPHARQPQQPQPQQMQQQQSKGIGFGQHGFSNAMAGQVNGQSVIAIDDSKMMLQGTQHGLSSQDVLSQRNQQDQMFLARR